MNDKLIPNNIKDQEEILNKEIKKMFFIKYLNLFISISRFLLLVFLISLMLYFPNTFMPKLFTAIIGIFVILILPLITIYLFIILITGTIQRDFWIKKKPIKFSCYNCFFCCCIMSKNVTFLKRLTLLCSIFDFAWSFILLHYYLKDLRIPNNERFFPFSWKGIFRRIFLNYIDSILLSIQFYCFYYSEYFLNKVEIYIEYYKRLIIKKKNKEADFVRNILPYDIDYYKSSEESELQNV